MYNINKLTRLCFTVWLPFVWMAWLGKQLFPYRLNAVLNPVEFTFLDLRVFFSHVMPLLYVVAALMQILFVDKLYQYCYERNWRLKRKMFLLLFAIIAILAIGTSVLIWQREAGFVVLFSSIYRLFAVQLAYWLLSYGTWVLINKLNAGRHISHIFRFKSHF